MMNQEHRKAQELSSLAALYVRQSRISEARRLFAEAAIFEKLAFTKAPLDKPRTRGILAVSLAALLFKAGAFREAERQIEALLSEGELTTSARRQLEDLLNEIKESPEPKTAKRVRV